MMRRLTDPQGNQRGVALTEFAIILPVLLILVFGIWEFGRIFDAWLVVTNASREGARYAVEIRDNNEVELKVLEYLEDSYGTERWNNGDIASHEIDVDRPANSGPVTVTVAVDLEIFAPLAGLFPDEVLDSGAITLTGRTVMRQ